MKMANIFNWMDAGTLFTGAFIAGIITIGIQYTISHHNEEKEKQEIVVGYAADPDVKNDGPIQLGYIGHRFSVTCATGYINECTVDIQNDGKNTIKRFPYVKQEWFTPTMKNRPYHSLDVIMKLPSYNGNGELRFGDDIKANADIINVMDQNGWIFH